MRGKGIHIAAGPISYRERIEAHYAANPTASIKDVWAATGAPRATVIHVRSKLLAAGRLKHLPSAHRGDPYAAV